jgi:hypothetical protein
MVICEGTAIKGVCLDKKVIMSALEVAVDALLQKDEHLVTGLDLLSVRDGHIIAKIHLEDGKPIFFCFFDRPEKKRGDDLRKIR